MRWPRANQRGPVVKPPRDRRHASWEDEFDDEPDDEFDEEPDDEFDADWDDEPTIECPYCGREIHEDAQRCPHCERYISDEDAPPQLAR